jgi:hypothetical protein
MSARPEESTAAVLAHLLAQLAGEGADAATLRAVAEQAGELGATRALTRLGLADASAAGDMAALRDLLQTWRAAKRSVWRAVFGWVTRTLGALLLLGLAMRLGVDLGGEAK